MTAMGTPLRYLAILDVGHGGCCVLSDDRGTLVIDTGLGTTLQEFLSEQKISQLDVVLLSHADEDHISGLTFLLASGEITIGRVRMNPDAAKRSKLWRNLLYELELQEAKGALTWNVQLTAESGEDFSVGRVAVRVVAPGKAIAGLGSGNKTADDKLITNHSISVVVHLSQDGKGIAVIPGDIDDVGLGDLSRRKKEDGKDVTAPILIYPHHGGRSGGGECASFVAEVCDLFKPRVVVFSIGRGKHGTPRPEVVEAVRRRVPNVRIACTQLSEHCSPNLPSDTPSHLLPIYSHGKQDGKCCAGTMLVDLDSLAFDPEPSKHEEFVIKHAEKALCRRSIS